MPKAVKKDTREEIATSEYTRLIEKYKKMGVDEDRLLLDDKLIMKVAELYAILESMKSLPTIVYSKKNPADQKETAAGKARVQYMAQYSTCMLKLNKDLLGDVINEEDDLADYE